MFAKLFGQGQLNLKAEFHNTNIWSHSGDWKPLFYSRINMVHYVPYLFGYKTGVVMSLHNRPSHKSAIVDFLSRKRFMFFLTPLIPDLAPNDFPFPLSKKDLSDRSYYSSQQAKKSVIYQCIGFSSKSLKIALNK